MKSRNLFKLIVGVILVAVMAISIPLVSSCAAPGPAPTPTPEPGVTPTPEPTPEPAEEAVKTETWRVQVLWAPAQANDITRPWLDNLEKSLGRIQFELYAGGELMPCEQMFKATQDGTLEMSFGCQLATGCDDPLADLSCAPAFMYNSSAELTTLWELKGVGDMFKESIESLGGVKCLGISPTDPMHLITTKPIRSLADVKGLKISSFPPIAKPFERAGAVSVHLDPSEFYLAGTTGRVDGLMWCGGIEAVANSWHEAYPYFLGDCTNGAGLNPWYINLDSWNSLSSQEQAILEQAMESLAYRSLNYYYDGEAISRPEFTEITYLPPAELAEIKGYAEEYMDELAQKSPKHAELVQIYRDYSAEVEAASWGCFRTFE